MNKGNLNKLVTNYPVSLTNEEVENLSLTLSAVRTAGGGGGEGKTYNGVGFVSVNNTNNTISLTTEADEKLNQPIPTKVSDLTDSASYQTTAGMASYETTQHASQTYLTKSSADNDYAPLSTTADVDALKAVSGDFSLYYKKTETSSKVALSDEFAKYVTITDFNGVAGDVSTLKSASSNWNKVSDKLDTTAFSTVSGTFLTEVPDTYATKEYANDASANAFNQATALIPDVSNFITKDVNDLTNYYKKTQTSSDSELAEAFGSILKYNVTAAAGIEVTTATDAGVKTYGISMTAQPVVTDTRLSGYNGIAAEPDGNVSGLWDVGLTQDMLNTINGKLDSTEATQTYLEKATYASDSATFLTKTSADNDYAPKTITATVNTLTGASADWNEVSAKLGTAQYANDSATFVTSSSNTITGTKQYALTTAGWAEVSTPTIPDITATSGISANGFSIGLTNTAIGAITSVYSKVDKPTSLENKYLVLRTDNAGNVSGWCDFQDQSYSKTEAQRTFVATANIDSTTLSGDGKSVSTKLGVKTDVIATKDYVNSSFLPLSGGTVSGELVVSGGGNFDTQFLKITRENVNGNGRIGLGSSGPLAFKVDDANSHTTQINISPNTTNDQLVQVQHNGNQVGFLIPAVTATTTAGLTNDGILHIILES